MTASTRSFGAGGSDYFVSKIDSAGTLQWSTTYGGNSTDLPWRLQEDLDGNYLITGYTSSFGAGSYDANLTKIDPTGNLLWSKTYGENRDEYAYSLVETPDGSYLMAGTNWSTGGDYNLTKINSNRNL